MQKKVCRIVDDCLKKDGKEHDKHTVFPHLVEEIGELAREYHNSINNWRDNFDKEKFSKELSDVLSQLLILARDFDVDIETAFEEKIKEWRKRFELD